MPRAGWTTADWKACGLLAGIPAILLAAAAAAGYPLITGDDLTQNYPLEELSGQILRHGHLPLWDAYLWSGTPLLGGTNAHALLPITLVFAVLPPLAAWVVGALEGAVVVGGLSAVGAGLYSIGIPKDSILKYETAIKTDKYLLVAHGTTSEAVKAKDILGTTAPSELNQHTLGAAGQAAKA